MSLLSVFLLRVLHFIYTSALLLRSYWKSSTWTPPLPVEYTRRRIPQHLAILLVLPLHDSLTHVEDSVVQSVLNAVAWCRAAGITKLTVYERTGMKLTSQIDIVNPPPRQVFSWVVHSPYESISQHHKLNLIRVNRK